ncbi:DUF6908 domain-containing protein [Halorubrum pallidum]|uniref:DUF6908 domain-containing protein n=1 Tax=Halorubrum pallidum TaxID=1526114 RepID=A0ABD5SZ50_9EURY
MDTLKEILSNLGVESVEEMAINDPYTVEVPAHQDLTIEKVMPGKVSIGHYYRQRGDLMSDPEVWFDVEGDEWTPISFSNDPYAHEEDPDGLDLSEFLQVWEKNLRSQGFVEAAAEAEPEAT